MDEALAQIKDMGWDSNKLPDCWSFVHVDVPSSAAAAVAGDNLAADVNAQGGTYIGITNPGSSYPNSDEAAFSKFKSSSRLANSSEGIRDYLKWRPDPDGLAAGVNIIHGAGAFRAIGRVLTISAGDAIARDLESVISKLINVSSNDGDKLANVMGEGVVFEADAQPIILLVSSMAGGTGSSMILDVADIINGLTASFSNSRFDGRETAAFLYTADVFKRWPTTYLRAGAQTLAAVSELVHAETRIAEPWNEKEWRQLVSGGIVPNESNRSRGPRVIFPVGGSVDGRSFGDNPIDIYRGFSRVLTPILVSSGIQDEFQTYVQANWSNAVSVTRDLTGLVTPVVDRSNMKNTLPALFGGFGSSTLSTGRDRYKEYAAQRIARRAAEILYEGFERASSEGSATRIAKVQAAATRLYPRFQQLLNLDGFGGFDAANLQKKVLGTHLGSTPAAYTEKFVSIFSGAFNNGTGANVQTVLTTNWRSSEQARQNEIASNAKVAVLAWAQQMVRELQEALVLGVSEYGLAVGEELLNHLSADLQKLSAALTAQAIPAQDGQIRNAVQGIGKINGAVTPANPAVGDFNSKVRSYVMDSLRVQVNKSLAETFAEFQTTILVGIRNEMSKLERELQVEFGTAPTAVSSAAYRDAPLASWPKGSTVPTHFEPAVNEVLLTSIDSFTVDFERDIKASISGSGNADDALSEAARRVIARRETVLRGAEASYGPIQGWKDGNTGGNHPHISFSEAWRPVKLDPIKPLNPRIHIKLNASDLHGYAQEWLEIVGNPFEIACRLSISNWLESNPDNKSHFSHKLSEAITLASPLVELDKDLVSYFHGNEHYGVKYEFSTIPIQATDIEVTNIIRPRLNSGNKGELNWSSFEKQCKPASMAQVISISGTTAPYSPWSSKSITDPVNNAINHFRKSGGGLGVFWTNMRARTLSQFVPLAEDRILSFLRGWIIGRLTGRIVTEQGKHGFEVRVYRDKDIHGHDAKWLQFSQEVLGDKKLGIHDPVGGGDATGWNIPAILLESFSLAMSQISSGNTSAWDPYQEVIRLGNSMYSIGVGHAAGSAVALDNWINGTDAALGLKSQLSGVETPELATTWVSQIIEDMRSMRDYPITSQNFWNIDPVYEIIDLLEKAAELVKKELERENLGLAASSPVQSSTQKIATSATGLPPTPPKAQA
jgi:hypothetical protein